METRTELLGMFASSACMVQDGRMFFYTKYGDLVTLDLLSGKMDYADSRSSSVDARSIFWIDHRLYRLDQRQKKIIEIDGGRQISLAEVQACGAFIQFAEKYHSYIYVLYGNGSFFLDIDVSNADYHYMNLKKQLLHTENFERESSHFSYSGLHENRIYMFQKRGGYLLCYDLDRKKLKKCRMPAELGDCRHIAVKGDILFVLNCKNEVYRWDYKNGGLKLVWRLRQDQQMRCFGRIHFCGDKLVLLPFLDGKDIIFIDPETGQSVLYDHYPEDFGYIMPDQYKYVQYADTAQTVYYPMRSSCYFLMISKTEGTLKWLKPKMPCTEQIIERFHNSYKRLAVHDESVPIEEYLSIAVSQNKLKAMPAGSIGKNIWNTLKNSHCESQCE